MTKVKRRTQKERDVKRSEIKLKSHDTSHQMETSDGRLMDILLRHHSEFVLRVDGSEEKESKFIVE